MPLNLSMSEFLTHSTVRIEIETASGTKGTGTGFFFNFAESEGIHVPAIVTNKHVVEGAVRGGFHLTLADENGSPVYSSHEIYSFEQFTRFWTYHPDPNVDLCAMPIAQLLQRAEQENKKLFYTSWGKTIIPSDNELFELTAMEDVTMVGYPNGIWDERHNLPVLRRGITATHPNFDWNGNPEFLIDAACFPGSSGSPVFLFNQGGYPSKSGATMLGNRIKLLGVLYAGPQHVATGEIKIVKVPIVDKQVSVTSMPNNLGMVIKARKLAELENIFALKRKTEIGH